ncbi:MAG: 4-hydroxy-tetrahydrodipicolinate reductase, partial [Sneathiella sp.]|nr:4-hydroxy-tetrahydrodipicolinate reductase [Sneathiella sp.]
MSDMKIGIVGCAGRMGRMLVKQVTESDGGIICGGIEPKGSPFLGQDIGSLAGVGTFGIPVTQSAESLFDSADA